MKKNKYTVDFLYIFMVPAEGFELMSQQTIL